MTFSNIDQDGYEGQNGNIRQDPMFYDTGWDDNGTPDDPSDDVWVGDDDYHLQQDSPCINAGDNAALPPDTTDLDNDGDTTEPIPLDLDGEPRIIDGVVDMGAYEYVYQNPSDELAVDFGGDRYYGYCCTPFTSGVGMTSLGIGRFPMGLAGAVNPMMCRYYGLLWTAMAKRMVDGMVPGDSWRFGISFPFTKWDGIPYGLAGRR